MNSKGNLTGIIFFLEHFLVEIICFTVLRHYYPLVIAGTAALLFDCFAFVPQGLFGELMGKFRKIPMGTIAVILMAVSIPVTCSEVRAIHYSGIVLLGCGNAILHEYGAFATVSNCGGKIFPTALFVSGGSFGLIIGQTMGQNGVSLWWLSIPLVCLEVIVIMTRKWREVQSFPVFNAVQTHKPEAVIILIAFIVTAVRSFLGYAIPISWRKELWQSFLLFFVMGLGKAAGGYLVDRFGARRVGVLSTLVAIPFLIVGNNNMVISVIGVCLFSMTMCITFEMILSVLPQNPGISFGVTTIGLFMGILPVFFVRFSSFVNSILVVVLSLLCSFLLYISCSDYVQEE